MQKDNHKVRIFISSNATRKHSTIFSFQFPQYPDLKNIKSDVERSGIENR